MSDLKDHEVEVTAHDVESYIGDDYPLVMASVRRMATEIRRRREAHALMLLEVETLLRYVERGDSRHPRTVEAVRNILDAIRKAGV